MQKDPLTVSKAKSYLEKALSHDPKYLPAIFMLVEILESEGMFPQAINLLQKQVSSQCNPPQVHLKLAELLCKNNMEDKAADHFSIALRLDPNNRDAREGLSRLDPASSRGAVHDVSGSVYELEDIDLDDDEDEHDVSYEDMNISSFILE
jgi:tetratricopeptide (TPR) repeat protein